MNWLSEPGGKLVGDIENRDPMRLGPPGSAPSPRPTTRVAAPRRADRLRSVMERPAQAVTPLAELRKTSHQQTMRSSESWGGCSTIPKSSWKEEVKNQELQARFLAGKGATADPLPVRGRSSWREEMENRELRQGKSVRCARQTENRDEADMVEKSEPKPPPPPPTASEMVEIKAKVQSVLTAGSHYATEDISAACRIMNAFRASKTRYENARHLSAQKIQAIWRGVGPRREMAAALHSLALKHVAATTIQKTWRMITARSSLKCFIAARKIQAAWRGYSPRTKYMHYLVSKAAAIRIQSVWRSFRCYCLYMITVDDIVIVQRVARQYIERRKSLLQRSATHIQRVFRGRKGRKVYARKWKKYIRERSARNIQRVFRGSRGRITAARVRTIIHAATTIQACWRGYEARQNYWLCIGSAIDIQSIVRGITARKRFAYDLRCIVLSQSAVRRWLGRRQLERLHDIKKECESATRIQALWRCHSQHQKYVQYKLAKAAATKIQSAWRSYICYTDYIFTLADIVLIQRLARKYIGRMHAATTIQKTWRKYVCYTDYIFTLVDIVTIQRSMRGHIGRKIYAAKHEQREQQRALERLRQRSATDIQRLYRGTVDRSKAVVLRSIRQREKAAVRIQSVWRTYVVQGIFWHKLICAIQIQSWTRGLLGRLHYIDSLGSIILSQCAVRRWIARRKYNQMRLIEFLITTAKRQQEIKNEATAILQKWYRNTVHPKITNQAATKIQHFFRMAKAILDRKRAILMKRLQEVARQRTQAAIVLQSFVRMDLAMRELAALAECKRRVNAAIKVQAFCRMTLAIAQRSTALRALAATKIQSLIRMAKSIADLNALVHAKRCDIAATKIQAFFRMIKAMVDREIRARIKRRKIRRMLKNRTQEVDDFLLEEAWQDMSIIQVTNILRITDGTATT
jgi:hypothetical protein